MCEIDEERQSDELLMLGEFIEHFNVHYSLLLRRYKKFRELSKYNFDNIDLLTYLDIIVVQLRAMCVESPQNKKNYTVQTLLKQLGEPELAQRIDDMLEEEFLGDVLVSGFTIKKALKLLADRFICHYDNFDGKDSDGWYYYNMISRRLCDCCKKVNLDYIMNIIIECVGEGLTIKM